MASLHSKPNLVAAALVIWALLIAVSLAAGGRSETRVCVSSATASPDAQGHVEEAERWALSAVESVGMQDMMSRSNVSMVLGLVRAAQGRDAEAELLLREAIDLLAATDLRNSEPEPLAALAGFLRDRGRQDEAAVLEERIEALLRPESAARII